MQEEVMQKSKEALVKAHHYTKLANHILKTTYAVVKEPKVLLLAFENIFLASTNAIAALLYFERSHKHIPPFHNSFNSKYHIFTEKLAKAKNFSTDEYAYIENMRNVLLFHKKSPVEFSRNDDFVICSDDYDIEKITFEETNSYLHKTTQLIKKIEMIV